MVLGVVSSVADLELVISLPGNLTGRVAITEISDPITAAVARVANSDEGGADDKDEADEDDDAEVDAAGRAPGSETELPDLSRMFTVGQTVRCAVVSKAVEGDRHRLHLSLRPSLTNVGVTASHLLPGYVRFRPSSFPTPCWGWFARLSIGVLVRLRLCTALATLCRRSSLRRSRPSRTVATPSTLVFPTSTPSWHGLQWTRPVRPPRRRRPLAHHA